MSLINEFKAFAVRGNVVDMAVGIVIGAAFGKIVSSFVDGVIMPPLGLLMRHQRSPPYALRGSRFCTRSLARLRSEVCIGRHLMDHCSLICQRDL